MAKQNSGRAAMPPLTGVPLIVLTAGVALATFMEVLDLSIVNVSVYTIAGSLGVSQTEGTMAISAYSLASAIMQPLTGWIARRFGEVHTFCLSVLLFIVFSAACGLSTSMPMLIVFRLLQGMASGPMVPLSQTLLLNNYPPKRRPIALSLWAMTVVVAPVFGPIMGGWITDNYSWSWIFLINIPVGIFSLIITWTLLRKRESKKVKVPVDAIGLFLLAVGVGSLQFMLDNGNQKDWFASHLILGLGLIALVSLTFLVAWELMHKNPIVDLNLFKRRNFSVGIFCLSLGMFAFFGGTVVLPNWLQQVMGYTATWAGFAVAPSGVLAFFMSPLVGLFQDKIDTRIICTVGFAIFSGASFWMAGFDTHASFFALALPRFVMGGGIALFFVPVNQVILAGLSDAQTASASGLANFFRTLATSVATAVSTTLYDHRTTYHHAVLTANIEAGGQITQTYLEKLKSFGLQMKESAAALNHMVDMQAATLAVNDVFWVFGLIFGVCVMAIWIAKPPFDSGGPAGP
jgi:DHA2 family multidrug resistance protein